MDYSALLKHLEFSFSKVTNIGSNLINLCSRHGIIDNDHWVNSENSRWPFQQIHSGNYSHNCTGASDTSWTKVFVCIEAVFLRRERSDKYLYAGNMTPRVREFLNNFFTIAIYRQRWIVLKVEFSRAASSDVCTLRVPLLWLVYKKLLHVMQHDLYINTFSKRMYIAICRLGPQVKLEA